MLCGLVPSWNPPSCSRGAPLPPPTGQAPWSGGELLSAREKVDREHRVTPGPHWRYPRHEFQGSHRPALETRAAADVGENARCSPCARLQTATAQGAARADRYVAIYTQRAILPGRCPRCPSYEESAAAE